MDRSKLTSLFIGKCYKVHYKLISLLDFTLKSKKTCTLCNTCKLLKLLYPFNYNLHITITLAAVCLKSSVIDKVENRNELESFYMKLNLVASSFTLQASCNKL